MNKREDVKKKARTLSFRLDGDSARVLDELAEQKGMTVSDFFRGVVDKILVPLRDEDEARAAAIEALPSGAQEKAMRAVDIQKRLRALRAARPKTNLLSSLFQDGDGAAHDGEARGLEVELAVLKKSFEAEVAGLAAPVSCEDKKAQDFLAGRSEALVDGEEVDGEEVDGEEVDGEEVDGEEVEKTDAEKAADRFLEITGLINSLRGCRVKRSWLDNYFDGGPPVCDLLVQELEVGRGAAVLDEELFEKLRADALRAVALKVKRQELVTAGADEAGPLVKGIDDELSALRADVMADAKKRKGPAKKLSFWDSI